MAEGGFDDPWFEDDDWRNDDDDAEQQVNATQPFRPGAASTPYHCSEEIEMQMRHRKQTGLPDTSYEETPLLVGMIHEEDQPALLEKAKDFIRRRFPKLDFGKLRPIGFSKKGNRCEIVY